MYNKNEVIFHLQNKRGCLPFAKKIEVVFQIRSLMLLGQHYLQEMLGLVATGTLIIELTQLNFIWTYQLDLARRIRWNLAKTDTNTCHNILPAMPKGSSHTLLGSHEECESFKTFVYSILRSGSFKTSVDSFFLVIKLIVLKHSWVGRELDRYNFIN